MFQVFTIMHLINGLTYWIEHSERSAAISQSSSVLLAWKRAQAEAARVKLKYTETEVLY